MAETALDLAVLLGTPVLPLVRALRRLIGSNDTTVPSHERIGPNEFHCEATRLKPREQSTDRK